MGKRGASWPVGKGATIGVTPDEAWQWRQLGWGELRAADGWGALLEMALGTGGDACWVPSWTSAGRRQGGALGAGVDVRWAPAWTSARRSRGRAGHRRDPSNPSRCAARSLQPRSARMARCWAQASNVDEDAAAVASEEHAAKVGEDGGRAQRMSVRSAHSLPARSTQPRSTRTLGARSQCRRGWHVRRAALSSS